MPLDTAIAGFLTTLRAGKPSPHTITAYAVDLHLVRERLAEDPGQLVVADLTAARLRAGFASYADGHAKSSVRRAWSTWNRLCDHLVVEGQLAGNPMAAVPKPKAARSAPQAFTDADMAALLGVLVAGRVPARYPWPIRDYAWRGLPRRPGRLGPARGGGTGAQGAEDGSELQGLLRLHWDVELRVGRRGGRWWWGGHGGVRGRSR
ncbi:MAG: site-specific integrase [Candidatus Nanopelagicales bacterium]